MSDFGTPPPADEGTEPAATEPARSSVWRFLLGLALGFIPGAMGTAFAASMLTRYGDTRLYVVAFGFLGAVVCLVFVLFGKQTGIRQGFLAGMALGFMLSAACFGLFTAAG